MADPRLKRYASILVNHSMRVKRGEKVIISATSELAKPLVLELYSEVIGVGGHPLVEVAFEECMNILISEGKESQIGYLHEARLQSIKDADCYCMIRAPRNKKSLSNADPKRLSMRGKAMAPVSNAIVNGTKRVLCNFPTEAFAQGCEMSLSEYEDFLYGASNVDWEKMRRGQKKLMRILDRGKVFRMVGEETDISISIDGRRSVQSFGLRNMPDGEVFISPIEDSAEGCVYFDLPAVYQGREVNGIRLTFKRGKVVEASAEKNEDFLLAMLDTDKGARFLGEVGIGTNYSIKSSTKDILCDEKIGGTVHLAVGKSYEMAGGKNVSAIHWDLIKDLRKKAGKKRGVTSAIYIDDVMIQRNGRFTI